MCWQLRYHWGLKCVWTCVSVCIVQSGLNWSYLSHIQREPPPVMMMDSTVISFIARFRQEQMFPPNADCSSQK